MNDACCRTNRRRQTAPRDRDTEPSMWNRGYCMPIITTSFSDAQTLAITFEVGDKTSHGKIINYVAQAGDDTSGDVLIRHGKQIGWIVGANRDKIHTFDTFVEDKAIDFFKLVNGAPQAALEESYKITIGGVTYTPEQVFHKATIIESARTSMVWPPEFVEKHTVQIKLNDLLKPGESIHIDFQSPLLKDFDIKFTPESIRSDAVHVSQIGFTPDDPLKIAFLSNWKGLDVGTEATATSGETQYKAGTAFHVVDTVTGRQVYTGKIEMSQAVDNPNNFWQNYNKTDVYKMDFSSVTKPGTYHITVDGVGTSYDFKIADGVWQDVFETSAHAFYEQRSGIAKTKEFTDWVRPRDHHPDDGFIIKQSTATLMDTDMGLNLQNKESFTALVEGATDVDVKTWGGWRDAADFDRRIQHTQAINDLLSLADIKPDFAKNTSLHIPESKNGIPDLIDEALFGLDFFKRLQHKDGGVGGGVEFEGHPKNAETSWTDSNKAFAYAPDAWSSLRYACSAAKAAGMIEKYDSARADGYVASAIKAIEWADNNTPDYAKNLLELTQARNLAYAELYRTTGDEKWNKLYLETTVYGHKTDLAYNEHMTDAAFVYARTHHAGVDKAVQKLGINDILSEAEFNLAFAKDDGFMAPTNRWAHITFTGLETTPRNAADFFVKAHMLTGDVKWEKAMIGAVQFLLGANPMNQPYMTGIGSNPLREIMDIDGNGLGKGPIPGISVYGQFNFQEGSWTPWWTNWTTKSISGEWQKPVNESWLGWNMVGPIAEYTVQDQISSNTFLLGYLASLHKPVKADPGTPVTPVDPPVDGGQPDGGDPAPVTDPVPADHTFKSVIHGGTSRDAIAGTAKADLIKAGNNADMVISGDGNDKLDLGGGNDRGYGGHGNDAILGKGGQDFLSGEGGKDHLDGGGGHDVLLGDVGADTLLGGADGDLLFGGAGKDVLSGGSGRDEFVFTALNEGGDKVTDFAKGDKLAFRGSVFGDLHRGKLPVSLLETTTDGVAHKTGEHFVWDKVHHDLWYDKNGAAAGGATLMAHFETPVHLTASDFMII